LSRSNVKGRGLIAGHIARQASRSDVLTTGTKIARQAAGALWLKHFDSETIDKQLGAALDALIGIKPRDELDGMMALRNITPQNYSPDEYAARRRYFAGNAIGG
jgi:hypothetical protein